MGVGVINVIGDFEEPILLNLEYFPFICQNRHVLPRINFSRVQTDTKMGNHSLGVKILSVRALSFDVELCSAELPSMLRFRGLCLV